MEEAAVLSPADYLLADENLIPSEQMRLVLDVSSRLAMTADLDELLRHIATAATKLAEAERASIFLHDPKTDELWTKVALLAREIRVPSKAGIVGAVFQANESEIVPEPYADPRFNPEPDRRNNFRTRNLLTVPVKNLQRRPIGVLQVVNRVGGPFTTEDQVLIELLADQAGVAIQRQLLADEARAAALARATLEKEMELARKVQFGMIPDRPPRVKGLAAAGWVHPASYTGGDAYDLWTLGDGRLGLFLGDAAGHGLAPALVISQARTLMRALSDINCDPFWVLPRVNVRLGQDLDPSSFVTAFLACISGDGVINWCSAGHGPMLIRRRPDAPVEVLEPLGPPIGVMPELTCDPCEAARLEVGGILVVMSDGIFEARNRAGEFFEPKLIVELLDRHRGQGPDGLVEVIKDAVQAWQGGDEPVDDQTLVIVQRTGS